MNSTAPLAPRVQDFYVTGGTLRQDAPCYVERQADRALYEGLRRGEFCYVLTARQMGKSSLMVRTAARLREEGVAVAILDFTAIGQNLSPEQWYGGLLDHLGMQLGLEDELDEFWLQGQERLGPLQRWLQALERVVLPHCPGRIVLFLDEIDAVRSLPFSTDEFFAGIRECYNRRAEEAGFARLTFCLLGVASPSDLIRDTRTTPFNIGRRVELTDFTAAEAVALAGVLARDEATGRGGDGATERPSRSTSTSRSMKSGAAAAQVLLARVLYWTGGHPYLTQRLCQAVAEETGRGGDGGTGRADKGRGGGGTELAPSPPRPVAPSPRDVDRQCAALFLSPSAREKDDNLLFVRERLLRSEADRASLLDLYAQIWAGKRVGVDDTNPLIDLLRLAGIARLSDGRRAAGDGRGAGRRFARRPSSGARLLVRNRIYEQVFDREWVAQHMPDAELRRQRAAYRRGLLRFAAVAGAVVVIMAGLTFAAIHQASRAEEREREARRNLYFANMNLAQQDWETGNLRRLRQLLEETRDSPERSFEWYYWQRLCHLDRLTFRGHTSGILSLACFPDGKHVVSSSSDYTVRIWNAGTGREIRRLGVHWNWPQAVAVSPDGRHIATASGDGRLADATSGRELLTFPGHTSNVLTIAFSPDGRRIVTGSYDHSAKLWDAATGRELLTFRGHPDVVERVALSPDGQRAASSSGSIVKVWNVATGSELFTLTGHALPVRAVSYSPDGRRIVTGSLDATATVWDAATGRAIRTLTGHASGVIAAGFSPDGRRIATGSHDSTARIWEVRSGQALFTLKGHTEAVTSVAFSPDGHRLFTGSDDRTVKEWGIGTSGEALTFPGYTDGVSLLRRRAERAGSRQRRAYIPHDVPQGRRVLFTGDGQRVVTVSGGNTAAIWVWGQTRSTRVTLTGHTSQIQAVAVSRDGRRIATGGPDRSVRVWDAFTGRRLLLLKGRTGKVHAVAFSPDGRWLVIGSDRYAALVCDAGTGRERLQLRGHRGPVLAAAFSPDGRQLVTGSTDDTIRLWDAANGRERLTLTGGVSRGYGVAYSADGRRIAVSQPDGTVKLWDSSGRALLTLGPNAGGIMAGAFSPDGRRFVTAGADNTARVWDTGTGREVLALKDQVGIMAAAFSPDGTRIVTGSADGKTQIREAASPAQVAAWTAAEAAAEQRRTVARRELAARFERRAQEGDVRAAGGGFIRDWLILAPIPLGAEQTGADGVDREQIPGEAMLRPRPGDRLTIEDQELIWRQSRMPEDVMDFNDFLQQQTDRSAAYAVCYLTAPQELRDLQMKIGNDDQARVYLNGQEVFRCRDARALAKDHDTVGNLTLRRGTNVLVFKVVNEGGDWQGCIRVVDRKGRPVKGIVPGLTP
jgi:WD40 repeat protein